MHYPIILTARCVKFLRKTKVTTPPYQYCDSVVTQKY